MSGITGRVVNMAFAKYATNSWNVAASVTKVAYFASDAGIRTAPAIIEDRAFGQQFLGTTETGNFAPVDTTLEAQARYDDHMYIWDALAMGSPAAVVIATSAAGQVTSWRHVMDLAPSTDGLGLTLATDKVQYVEEVTSAKVTGWIEKVGDNGVMTVGYKIVGSDAKVTSSVNINSTVAGASFPALGNRVAMKQGTIRMNLQSAGALGASDTLRNVSGFEFDWNREQDKSNVFGLAVIDEPADNEFPAFQLKFTFDRMNTVTANSLRAAFPISTVFKADLTYLGQNINSTDAYTKLYQWPHLQVVSFETPASGAQQLKPEVMFKGYKPASAPTGMSGVTLPFRLTRVMTNSIVAF